MSNYLPPSTQQVLVRAIGLGMPIRHIEHVLGVAQDTVRRYVRLAGEMAIDFLDMTQVDLEIKRAEFDEFYSFVGARKENVAKMKRRTPNAGQQLHFFSVVPNTGFIANYMVAPSNDLAHTRLFVKDFFSRLKRNPGGSFVVPPTILSDGHGAYLKAIEDSGETSVTYLRLTKKHTDRTPEGKKTNRRFDGVFRETLMGRYDGDDFWTNNVEAVNRSARAQIRRVARRTNAFSKRFDVHVGQIAFWVFYHNYCLIPDRRRVTPAMEMGVTDKLFEAEQVVQLIAQYQEKAKAKALIDPAEEAPVTPVETSGVTSLPVDAPYWLYHNFDKNTVRIHKAECSNCRQGAGRGGEKGLSGFWLPAQSLEAATVRAEQLEPGNHSMCNMCIGVRRRMAGRN